ncbi:MAG TPA: hypothetical protein VMR06_08290, partial [Dokdonella sp.]|uniref:hypothetical protein n=1 Tax=Dokdonella sp. TaxID=2291710 RepID=UPI002BD4DEC7
MSAPLRRHPNWQTWRAQAAPACVFLWFIAENRGPFEALSWCFLGQSRGSDVFDRKTLQALGCWTGYRLERV